MRPGIKKKIMKALVTVLCSQLTEHQLQPKEGKHFLRKEIDGRNVVLMEQASRTFSVH
jgi:flagellar basal body-associated protein FliL